jgi:hypothetical protein
MYATTTQESADDLVGLLAGVERLEQAATSLRYRALSLLAGHPPYEGDPVRGAGAETACVLRILAYAANQVAEAETLTRLFSEVLDRLAAETARSVRSVRVRALIDAAARLDDATARRVQDLGLPWMPT